MNDADWNQIADQAFTRWGASARPIITDRTESAKLLAISLGLGTLFREDIKSEREWMKTPQKCLRGTAYTAVLQGRFDEVLTAVNRARNVS
jgi:hypothetical protein